MKRRNTPSQEAVLAVLTGTSRAMSQDAIEKRLTVAVDRATIYRILNRFCEDEILHKIVADDGKQYFAVCKKCDDGPELPANHFHFRCTQCETIECLAAPVAYSVPEKYQVQQMNCVLIGICEGCG